MRFNFFAGILALSAPLAVSAAPIAATQGSNTALPLVQNLQVTLNRYENSINATLSALPKDLTAESKKMASTAVSVDMKAMTEAINLAVADLTTLINNAKKAGQTEWTDLENTSVALQSSMIEASNTVNTALSVLGLTPLLSNLTPLAGSISCLILSLKGVADAFVPDLQGLLDPVFKGLSGFFGDLVL